MYLVYIYYINSQIDKELVAWPMYISLHHFIVLILIIHILFYDTRQEHHYFITNFKAIDKSENENKIKMLSRRRIEPMPTDSQCVSDAKNSKSCLIVNGEL